MSNASPSPSNTSRQWLIGLTLLAVLLLLLWWFWPSKPQTQQMGRGRFGDMGPVPVRLAEVKQGEFAIELKALGTVTSYNTVNVRSRVDGELVKVLFEEGQEVKAGELLAVIDPRPYQVALQQAQGALQENQAQLKNAELDLQRYKGLYDEDSIARQTLDTQQALVNQYRGSLQSNQADVATAKLNLDFTQIRAPISGRLGLRQLDVGNLVSGGDTTPLVVITQANPISVIFTIPEGDLPAVMQRRRDGTILAVEAWDRGERLKLADGVLESLDNQIDTTTGTVKLKARFDNAEQMLFPNQFVNVRLRVETREAATIIPSAAVQFGTQGTFVYVVDGDNKVSIRQVSIAASDAERSMVSEGVQQGERLVLEGTDRLRDGSEVEVVDPQVEQTPKVRERGESGRAAARNDA
ncbi:MdtA/MuxA family multidrug efflux RND transporter periplasmic adaptor subunit [Ectopseudomonas alcaliphila]|uniref:MdtA/MuxA family multidrug efflux RND transporter periplasmic adaptor subunit n=1 Tax=Ectopseudomonas alcaliphila TaxID=101564 RepID=A0A1G7EXB8_9GAMM|nr:MdtA/MuxA family multidrug efflux RND transporter periplasmic adaptor subunit [Pseudomonas alcaliphila]MDX5990942.1 MdtA/MuxA family multidrug efflux RND transporter periplasmic adaptor subunit [Pseudomonas alcaliphila]SDE68076.1 membrane fusion protein, multidrug efflux system [Pseudomonas alcaliphila]